MRLSHGRMTLAAAGMLVLAASVASAGTVHRVKVCSSRRCVLASAACVSENPQIFLTVAHALRDGHGDITIDMASGTPARARHVLSSASEDLAILVVDKGGDGKAFRVSSEYPKRGEEYELIGFPGGEPKRIKARCLQTRFGNLALRAFASPVKEGFSGGSVSREGVLYGIIAWTDERSSLATTGPTLIAMLRKAFPERFAQAAPQPPAEPEPPAIERPIVRTPAPQPKSTLRDPIASRVLSPDPDAERSGFQPEDEPTIAGGLLSMLPAVAPLLPWTLGPIGGAAAVIVPWLAGRWFRRRKARRERAPLPGRNMDEARQLVRLGRVEGRDPLLDAALGMFADDEAEKSTSDEVRQWWKTVTQRVEEIAPLSIERN